MGGRGRAGVDVDGEMQCNILFLTSRPASKDTPTTEWLKFPGRTSLAAERVRMPCTRAFFWACDPASTGVRAVCEAGPARWEGCPVRLGAGTSGCGGRTTARAAFPVMPCESTGGSGRLGWAPAPFSGAGAEPWGGSWIGLQHRGRGQAASKGVHFAGL